MDAQNANIILSHCRPKSSAMGKRHDRAMLPITIWLLYAVWVHWVHWVGRSKRWQPV